MAVSSFYIHATCGWQASPSALRDGISSLGGGLIGEERWLMSAPLLGEQKVCSIGSGISKVVPAMGLLSQALIEKQYIRVCVCVEGRNRAWVP